MRSFSRTWLAAGAVIGIAGGALLAVVLARVSFILVSVIGLELVIVVAILWFLQSSEWLMGFGEVPRA